MTEIRTSIYMAHDGTKFFTEKECRDYENSTVGKKWIEDRYWDFLKNQSNWVKKTTVVDKFVIVGNFSIYCNEKDGHTVITNLRTGRSGKSVCSNLKFFDRKTGIAIAWARYIDMEIPDYI